MRDLKKDNLYEVGAFVTRGQARYGAIEGRARLPPL